MSNPLVSEIVRRGVAALSETRYPDALREYEAALAIEPNDAEALSQYGLALLLSGRLEEAASPLLRAVQLEPNQKGFRHNLGQYMEATKDYQQAIVQYHAAVAIDPQDVKGWQKLGLLVSLRRDWNALAVVANAWTKARPTDGAGWFMLSRAAFELGLYVQAAEAYKSVLAKDPANSERLATYGRLCLHALDYERARRTLALAEQQNPNNAEMLAATALLHLYDGAFDMAEAYCLRCIAIDPEFAPAYTTLSRARRGLLTQTEFDTLTRIGQDVTKPADYRIPAVFAIAHHYDAAGDIDPAFASYQDANAISLTRNVSEGLRYDAAQSEARATGIIQRFPAPTPGANTPPGAKPIFIVGMPRSGTTLIEAVLSAHSRVFGGGERPMMQQILNSYLMDARDPAPDTLLAWAKAYLDDMPSIGRAAFVTDKHPLNFRSLGVIAKLFPNAVVVHVRRNPMETGLSIYRQEFSKFWTFANRLEDIGHFYGQYARLAAHWERAFKGRLVTVQYEDFAANFNQSAPALVSACGLEWEEACRNFQSAPRPIATFSAVQAREPVTVRAGKAETYAKHLAPLRAALEAAGVDPRTGALRVN